MKIIKREDGPVIVVMALLAIIFLLLLAQKGHAQQAEPAPTLKQIYDGYNEQYFFGLLPTDTRVQWGEITGQDGEPDMGQTDKLGPIFIIVVSKHYSPSPREARMTLLHEMCHVQIWQSGRVELDQHGPLWQDCMHRLADEGAFNDLW